MLKYFICMGFWGFKGSDVVRPWEVVPISVVVAVPVYSLSSSLSFFFLSFLLFFLFLDPAITSCSSPLAALISSSYCSRASWSAGRPINSSSKRCWCKRRSSSSSYSSNSFSARLSLAYLHSSLSLSLPLKATIITINKLTKIKSPQELSKTIAA